MWRVILQQNQTFRTFNAQMSRYPAWVTRTAILCAMAVIVIPVMLLIVAGLLVGVLVFAVLSLVARVMELFGGSGGAVGTADEPLRRNVQVIEDDAR
jgi:MFS superfamily sulfate permease-like transporter